MALKDLLNTFRQEKPEALLGKLDRYLLQLNGNKFVGTPQDREKGVWHPSSLSTTECIRKLVFTWLRTTPSNPDTISSTTRKIFDVGHHSGYQMQAYFWDMGILEGKWHCVSCRHNWWGISPRKCPKCKTKVEIWYNLHYSEVAVEDPEYNIKGHADGIINEDGQRRLLELKTIKNRDQMTRDDTVTFDELNAAKLEHMYQMNLYMHILTKYGASFENIKIPLGRVDKGIALYSAKNNQRQKEFQVGYLPEFIAPLYLRIDQTEHALKEGYLPAKIAEEKTSGHCRYCAWKDSCHGGISFREADNRGLDKEDVAL
jgi:hypothetical protein